MWRQGVASVDPHVRRTRHGRGRVTSFSPLRAYRRPGTVGALSFEPMIQSHYCMINNIAKSLKDVRDISRFNNQQTRQQ